MNKQKIIILFTVFVDVLGFGIVIPILPFYLGEFGAKPLTITLLFSTFSFFAFLSSPFLGALSDRIGRRRVLMASIFSTALGWFVFASAVSIPMLFLGRIIDGIAAGNFTTAQSYLVDISKSDKERTSNLGILGATFGIGFMVGPLIGGLLSTVSHAFPFYFAGGMALLNGIFALFMLPETNTNLNTEKLKYDPFLPLTRAYKSEKLRPIFIVWFIFSISFVVMQSVFALYAQIEFGYNAFQVGMFFTIIGVVVAFNQTVLLKRFWLRRFSEPQLQKIMMLILFIGVVLLGMPSMIFFFMALPFLGTGQAVLRVVIASRAAGYAEATTKGEIMGITGSIMSMAMVFGPICAGFLFEYHHTAPFITASVLLLAGFFYSKSEK
ncbi:MAG: MFS transporter [Bacteroidota bacterium]|nr:MFS transporter [Bacteroidota bacterium]